MAGSWHADQAEGSVAVLTTVATADLSLRSLPYSTTTNTSKSSAGAPISPMRSHPPATLSLASKRSNGSSCS